MRKENDNRNLCFYRVRFGIALVALWMLVACQATKNDEQTDDIEKVDIESTALGNAMSENPEVILSNHTCVAGLDNRWIASHQEYTELFMQLKGGLLSSAAQQPPVVDFKRYGVLLLTMGQQRTGGYGVTLPPQPMTLNNNVATLKTDWMAPSPDMMVIQMLTNPCLLVKVPRGAYSRLQVVDQHHQVKAELAVQ